MSEQETICAVATAGGEAAIGVIRISGSRALEIIREVCRRRRFEPRTMHGVVIRRDAEVIDRALVCFMPAPNSYTGEDVVEVHGHGGALNMERLLSIFAELGARLARPGEFTRRAFMNGRIDLTQAEAVSQVIAARSARALKNAQAVLAGGLGREVRDIRESVVKITAHLEGCIDFCEETEGQIDVHQTAHDHKRVEEQIERLAATYSEGRALDGVTVAIVGAINVGKSSLFNRLLGTTRALVDQEPGTTRDYLEAEVAWEGLKITLLDTAGERSDPSGLERAGQELARPVIQRSDLVVNVIDLSGLEPCHIRSDAELVVANKVDLLGREEMTGIIEEQQRFVGARPMIATSALLGHGIEEVRAAIIEAVLPKGGEGRETVMVTRRRQWDALLRARDVLSEGREALARGLCPELVVEHAREALRALEEVTGERFTEEVLDTVFASFCIGK
jgi:tRNA modification GTPase